MSVTDLAHDDDDDDSLKKSPSTFSLMNFTCIIKIVDDSRLANSINSNAELK